MLLASSYPLLNVFLYMLWFFLFFIWIWILISIIADIFRSHDLGGFAKAIWLLFIIFLPLIGVLVYLIARGHSMQDRAVQRAAQSQAQFDDYVRQTASGGKSTADELSDLAKLKESGAITDDDYEKAKAKILS
jgi:ABC-type multidrug transport system fused ATPase/permease subunit